MALAAQPLWPQHRSALQSQSGIPPEVLEREGVYSASREEVKAILGWDAGSAGVVFPYHTPDNYLRIRLDQPFSGPGYKKPAKYLSRKRSGNHLYIPTLIPGEVLAGTAPLIITEGEKKALAGVAHEIPVIGTAGVWSWKEHNDYNEQQDDENGILEDFNRVNWKDREWVALIYDSDINQAHSAWPAYGRLAEQLYQRGVIQVKVLSLPHVANGEKTGLDDYLLVRKPQDLRDLIDKTPVWVPRADGAQAFIERRINAAVERLKNEETADAAYDPDTLLALASASMWAETEYARAKDRLLKTGKRLERRAMDRQVKALVEEIEARQSVTRAEVELPSGPIETLLPNAPIQLRIPDGWHVSEKGVWFLDPNNKTKPTCACSSPILITQRLRRIDIGEERIEIAFFRDGGYRNIVAQPSTVFNSRSLVELADKGLPVSSENAKHIVRYLTDLVRANDDLIPRQEAVGHYGWVGSRAFLPGAAGDVRIDLDGPEGGYEEVGSFEEWLACAQKVRRHPMVRFALATAFAAPLLHPLGHRTFLVHFWGPSQGGKSASGYLILSVWGAPEQLFASFYATKVGLERTAALYADLPLVVDERQVVGDQQGLIEGLVYLLGLGHSKVRGTKGGGVERAKLWNTIVFTTGEDSLSSNSSATGVRTRAIEIYGEPFEGNESEAQQIYGVTKEHHGHAGPIFIRRLLGMLKEDPQALKTEFELLKPQIQEKSHRKLMGSHITALTVLAIADFYSSQWIFGEDDNTAAQDMWEMIDWAIQTIPTAQENDQANQALEFVRSWVRVNETRFGLDVTSGEWYGWFGSGQDEGYTYIFPSAFTKAMKEGGFNERRILRDFAERGWILVDAAGGRTHYAVLRHIGGNRPRVVALKPIDSAGEDGSENEAGTQNS